MSRTRLTVLVASLTVLAAIVGPAAAFGPDTTGVDPDTGLGGLAQDTGGLLGGTPDGVATYDGTPGWHVAVDDRAALEDWADSSGEREILRYSNDSDTAVVVAPASAIGTTRLDRALGSTLVEREYVQSVAAVQTVDTPEPPEPVSRDAFEKPDLGPLSGYDIPFVGAQEYPLSGIAMTEDANRSTVGDARDVTNASAGGNGEGVDVAILDDGVTYDEDLYGDRFESGKDFVADREARANNSWENVSSAGGHGDWVAGAAVANASNDSFDGMAPEANIYVGKVLGENGGTSADIVDGLEWANEQDVDIVSLSLGSQFYNPAIDAAIQDLVDNGTVVVIAAGNSAQTTPVGIASPADSIGEDPQKDGIVTVAATNTTEPANASVAHFSQRGPDPGAFDAQFDATRGADPTVAAPGMELTAMTADGKSTLSGTSMATPLVSGAAAQIMSENPDLNASEVEQRLGHGAAPMPNAGQHEVGAGMLDVEGAMDADTDGEDYYADQLDNRTTAAEARDEAYESLSADAGGWLDGVWRSIGA